MLEMCSGSILVFVFTMKTRLLKKTLVVEIVGEKTRC